METPNAVNTGGQQFIDDGILKQITEGLASLQEVFARYVHTLNHNGMQAVLCMTLIVAMPVWIYKRGNETGYKTAKRRFRMEIRDMITALIVT